VGLLKEKRRAWAIAGLVLALLTILAVVSVYLVSSQAQRTSKAELTQTLRQQYLQNEGHARRGPNFYGLALWLDQSHRLDRKLSEAEVLETLGPPDLVAGGGDSARRFVYYFEAAAPKDSVVCVTLENDKADFGFGTAAASIDLTGYRKWEPEPPREKPAPSEAGPASTP
jgi:hypothetical protein